MIYSRFACQQAESLSRSARLLVLPLDYFDATISAEIFHFTIAGELLLVKSTKFLSILFNAFILAERLRPHYQLNRWLSVYSCYSVREDDDGIYIVLTNAHFR